jgi:uncharacterized membrane protein YphA (DoxX/SURF4 family)
MRIAAGIMLMIGGMASLFCYVPFLQFMNVNLFVFDPIFIPLLMFSAAFVFTGGIFCLNGEYWKLCFAAALLAFLIMIYWIYAATGGFSHPLSAYPPFITGTLPIIFVCIRKREWQEISA